MVFTILNALPQDAVTIRAIQKETWLETYPNKEWGITRKEIEEKFENDDDRAKIRGLARVIKEDPSTQIFIAKRGKEIIGYCIVQKRNIPYRIQAMYILQRYQNKGVGSKLMEKALSWLGTDCQISLEVASYNTNAITFYQKFGFVESGPTIENVSGYLPSGKIIPQTKMIKFCA